MSTSHPVAPERHPLQNQRIGKSSLNVEMPSASFRFPPDTSGICSSELCVPKHNVELQNNSAHPSTVRMLAGSCLHRRDIASSTPALLCLRLCGGKSRLLECTPRGRSALRRDGKTPYPCLQRA